MRAGHDEEHDKRNVWKKEKGKRKVRKKTVRDRSLSSHHFTYLLLPPL